MPRKPPTPPEPPKPAMGKPNLTVVSGGPKKTAANKSRVGRPSHEPTPQLRSLAMLCAAAGYSKEATARTMKVGLDTFNAHYLDEWERGGEEANVRVSGTLFAIATDKTHPRCVTAAIFWMKARAGWSDRGETTEDDADDEADGVEVVRIGIGGAGGGKA